MNFFRPCGTVALAWGLVLASVMSGAPDGAVLRAQILSGLPGLNAGPSDDPVSVTAQVTPPTADTPAQLRITAKIEPKWHIYSITQAPGGPVRSKIALDKSDAFKLAGPWRSDPEPEKHPEPVYDNLVVETHEGSVTWSAPLELAGGSDLASLKISGKVTAQACQDMRCLLPSDYTFEATVSGTKAQPTVAPSAVDLGTATGMLNAATSKLETQASGTKLATGFRQARSHLVLKGELDRRAVAPGGKLTLRIHAEPVDGYHVYALGDSPPKIGNQPTLIEWTNTAGLVPARPQASAPPEEHTIDADGKEGLPYHEKPVDWTVTLTVPADAAVGEHRLEGFIGFQTCDVGCDQPTAARFSATLRVGDAQDERPAPLEFTPAKYGEASRLAAARLKPVVVGAAVQELAAMPSAEEPAATPKLVGPVRAIDVAALPWMMGSAFLGGLILNLMPCVLPVIGLKIFSLIEMAGANRRTILVLNLWFSAGLIAVFLVLATAASVASLGWGQQFGSTAFNIVMASIVFVMALSFLGIWEIPLPGFVGTGKTQNLAAREGPLGALTKGAVTTIMATPCSGPFLGSVFGFTLSQPPIVTYIIFLSIGLGMAAPYLLIGVFPALVRFLPKPGAWMETFKQVMGFMLLGAVVFVFTFLKTDYVVPTFALLIGLWAACWWIGRTPLYAGAAKLTKAYLGGGVVAAAVGVFAFTMLVPGDALIPWQPYSPTKLAELTGEGKTVMVDFTADWCLTCKTNLKLAINRQEVAQTVSAGGVVPLLADWTDGSEEIKQALERLGSNSIPVLAIFPAGQPQKPIVLRDLITKRQVLDALEQAGPSKPGTTSNPRPLAAVPR